MRTILALACLVALALLLSVPSRPEGQPAPAQWEIKAWASSHCDRCGKGLSPDPQDGEYVIGGKSYWLHRGCAGAVAAASRR